jgi:hypothetical protein
MTWREAPEAGWSLKPEARSRETLSPKPEA